MWNISDIRNDKNYLLLLLQSSAGSRKFLLEEVCSKNTHANVAFKTKPVPKELLITRDIIEISKLIPLDTGERFYVDAHGIWLTEIEMLALEDGEDVPWLNGLPPGFAPK